MLCTAARHDALTAQVALRSRSARNENACCNVHVRSGEAGVSVVFLRIVRRRSAAESLWSWRGRRRDGSRSGGSSAGAAATDAEATTVLAAPDATGNAA